MVGFDLPASMADYAGRVACTARGGRTGVVSTLIGENESKESLVQLMALLRATDSEVPSRTRNRTLTRTLTRTRT